MRTLKNLMSASARLRLMRPRPRTPWTQRLVVLQRRRKHWRGGLRKKIGAWPRHRVWMYQQLGWRHQRCGNDE